MKNFVFFSTSDLGEGRSFQLDRMISSIDIARGSVDCQLVLFLLLQNSKAADKLPPFPDFVRPLHVEGRLSLSAARNMMLRPFIQASSSLSLDTIVAFPDDDCWYPRGILKWIVKQFSERPSLDFWFCQYSSSPEDVHAMRSHGHSARSRDVVRNASSNTMVFRGSLLGSVGLFDEKMGVGTSIGGGEDTDFALRAFLAARQTRYHNEPLIGHRDKIASLRSKYYPGSLLALSRYAVRRPGIAMELARKLALGPYLVARREMGVMSLLAAYKLGLSHLGKPDFVPGPASQEQQLKKASA